MSPTAPPPAATSTAATPTPTATRWRNAWPSWRAGRPPPPSRRPRRRPIDSDVLGLLVFRKLGVDLQVRGDDLVVPGGQAPGSAPISATAFPGSTTARGRPFRPIS